MKINKIALCAVIVAGALCSCGHGDGWQVSGTVTNAADSMLYVEASTPGNWYVLDSIKLPVDGTFDYVSAQPAQMPSVYRLRLGNEYIYFPVDSAESVTLHATLPNFDKDYTLTGSASARGFMTVDSLINATLAGKITRQELKNELDRMVNRDSTCIVSYYIVGKVINNQPLYDPADRHDVKIIGNAANNFMRLRPGDPRTKELEQRWMAARQMSGSTGAVQLAADLTARPKADLKRYDRNGAAHDFDKVVTRGGVTVLNFTRYDGEASPANTVALKRVYDRYKNSGLEIFQVAYDPDELAWKRSAANMPWIAVWNSPTDNAEALVAYNADPLRGAPVSFVFNRNGELVKRVTNPDDLDAVIAPLL